jgi:hypothetical protein
VRDTLFSEGEKEHHFVRRFPCYARSSFCRNNVKVKTLWQPFEAEVSLNNIQEFSQYLKENTTLYHYKDQLVNAV